MISAETLKKANESNYDEIEIITREEAKLDITKSKKEKIDLSDIADKLMDDYSCFKCDGVQYLYFKNKFVPFKNHLDYVIDLNYPKLKESQISEIEKKIIRRTTNEKKDNKNYIPFANGIYDLENQILLPHGVEKICFNMIERNYNPRAYSIKMPNFLNELAMGDKDIVELILEMIGYCFYRENKISSIFFIKGDKANGKTTFLKVLHNLFGSKNCSSLTTEDLREKFRIKSLEGKLVNLGDDIAIGKNECEALLKRFSSGASLKIKYKGKASYEIIPYIKMIFTVNEMPSFSDKTGAFLRRLVILPFKNCFIGKENLNVIDELEDEDYEWLIKESLKRLPGLLTRKRFNMDYSKLEEEIKEFEIINNSVYAFLDEMWSFRAMEIEDKPLNSLMDEYNDFCIRNNMHKFNSIWFSKHIKDYFKKNKGLNLKLVRYGRNQKKIFKIVS